MPSVLDAIALEKMSDVELLAAFEEKQNLYRSMVGTLYKGSVAEALATITDEGFRRHDCALTAFRDRGIVPATWTDVHGVTHGWRSEGHRPHFVVPDRPVRVITCLYCALR